MKLDMNDPKGGAVVFHYPDIRISNFGFFSDIFNFKIMAACERSEPRIFKKANCWRRVPVSEANHVYPSEPPLPTPEG